MKKGVLLVSVQTDLEVIGLKSLHCQLLQHGFASHMLFLPQFSKPGVAEAVCELVDDLSPLFIGMGLMSVEYGRAADLTHALKSRFPDVPVLWGGVHPTLTPADCLDHADYVCVGEGERFIVDFARTLAEGSDPGHLNNLVHRRNGHVVQNPLHPLIEDLSGLPSPEHVPRDSFVFHNGGIVPLDTEAFRRYARYSGTTYSVVSSRGCPFSCTYCCNNALSSIYGAKRVRFREAGAVIGELKRAISEHPFITCINFQDDCFLARPAGEMERFCELYRQEVALPFIARSIPAAATEEKLAALKSAGLAWLNLGLQSGSDHVCFDIYKRRSGRQDFLEAARAVKKHGLAAFYDVILDNPFETDEDRLETVRTLMETPKPYYTHFFSLSLYPGTELRDRALEEGLIEGEEYRTKDYLVYKRTGINHLVRLATALPAGWVAFLLKLYESGSDSVWFRVNLAVARLFGIAFAEPITYFRVIRLSQQKSLLKTAKVLPYYLNEGFSRFWKQFS